MLTPMSDARLVDPSAWAGPVALAGVGIGALAWLVGAVTLGAWIGLVGLGAAAGMRRGALRTLGWLAGLALGAALAAPVGRAVEPLVASIAGTGGLLNRVASAVAAALAIALAAGVVGSELCGRLAASRPGLKRFDRWAGAGVGAAYGGALCLVVSWFVLAAEPIARGQIEWEEAGGRAAPPAARPLVRAAGAIRASPFGGLVDATNPLREADLLALAADFVAVTRDPEAMAFFMESDAMRRVSRLESVRRGLEAVRGDEALSGLFDDGEVSVGDVVAVLNSPTLLRMLDTTPVVEEFSPHAQALRAALREARSRVR